MPNFDELVRQAMMNQSEIIAPEAGPLVGAPAAGPSGAQPVSSAGSKQPSLVEMLGAIGRGLQLIGTAGTDFTQGVRTGTFGTQNPKLQQIFSNMDAKREDLKLRREQATAKAEQFAAQQAIRQAQLGLSAKRFASESIRLGLDAAKGTPAESRARRLALKSAAGVYKIGAGDLAKLDMINEQTNGEVTQYSINLGQTTTPEQVQKIQAQALKDLERSPIPTSAKAFAEKKIREITQDHLKDLETAKKIIGKPEKSLERIKQEAKARAEGGQKPLERLTAEETAKAIGRTKGFEEAFKDPQALRARVNRLKQEVDTRTRNSKSFMALEALDAKRRGQKLPKRLQTFEKVTEDELVKIVVGNQDILSLLLGGQGQAPTTPTPQGSARGTSENPIPVKTPQEAERIPRGQHFIGPDGVVRKRK